MSGFPVDDTTLVLLAEACRINPDLGRTTLHDFLDMGSRVKMSTLISDPDDDTAPVYEVEHEPGYEPFSPNQVILALIGEIQRLRGWGEVSGDRLAQIDGRPVGEPTAPVSQFPAGRSPVDDALDGLLGIVEAAEREGRWHLSGRDVINLTQHVATVRQRLAEQDTDIQRLREERDAAENEWRTEKEWRKELWNRAEAAEAEVRRYKKGLREIDRMDGRYHDLNTARHVARAALSAREKGEE